MRESNSQFRRAKPMLSHLTNSPNLVVNIGFEPMNPVRDLLFSKQTQSASLPIHHLEAHYWLCTRRPKCYQSLTEYSMLLNGGSGEIRTHGPFRIVCFQDRCNKPGSATLPNCYKFLKNMHVLYHAFC